MGIQTFRQGGMRPPGQCAKYGTGYIFIHIDHGCPNIQARGHEPPLASVLSMAQVIPRGEFKIYWYIMFFLKIIQA